MPDLPGGAVTFLFSDIEGSTQLWEQEPERMRPALARHDALARAAVIGNRGRVVRMTGDGIYAAFGDPLDAVRATLQMQQELAEVEATHNVALRARCGLHVGVGERRDNDFFGSAVNRAARIMSAAHGGQVLLSQAVVDCVRENLPAAVSLLDLGKVRLKDLSTPEHVYQVVHPLLRQEFPALRSLEATPNNLPQLVTSFVGREQALAELRHLLPKTRLLTLTGAGGCGKTRLSLQVAADFLEQFPDGAWLVDLAPLSDPGLVAPTVAKVLRLKELPGKPIAETLTAHLKDKRLLLILDNCEHLLNACAKLADTLVRQCPPLKILATSREALGMDGEQTYRVPSLSLPDPREPQTPASIAPFEAVQLFIDRALLARSDFEVTDQNAPRLASICHRLDGIPLAIELAAARVRSLSVEEIDGKLDQRFRLLTSGSSTALPRQQTLRSLIDWSYDLLSDAEKALLGRLSVFSGGWTLATAEHASGGAGIDDGEVLDLLTSLADKNLVIAEERDGSTRYRLLETVRQYARDRLRERGEETQWQRRHLTHFLALAEEAEQQMLSADQQAWLGRLEAEHDNMRSALAWCLAPAGDPPAGLRLAGALWRFWWVRGYFAEGRDSLSLALAAAPGEQAPAVRAKALNGAGGIASQQGDYPAAQALHEESLAIRRGLGDRRGIASSLGNLGNVFYMQGDYPAARRFYEECLVVERELGDRWGMAALLVNLGNLSDSQGDYPAARKLYEASLALRREMGDQLGIAASLHNLGIVATNQGDYPAARQLHAESLSRRRDLGDRQGTAESLEELADTAFALAEPGRAARIWGSAERLREEIGCPLPPGERPRYERQVAAARAGMADDAAFDLAWQDGRAMTPEQAIDYALAKAGT